jgi:Outer membrane lipoprotein-sorting protein
MNERRLIPFLLCTLLLAGCLAFPGIGWSQPGFQHPAPLVQDPAREGQELARKLRDSFPESGGRFSGALRIQKEGKSSVETPIRWNIIVGETNWQSVYEVGLPSAPPFQAFLVVHSPGRPNQYYQLSGPYSAGQTVSAASLDAVSASIPLGASDFSLADLGMDFLHWPQQRLLKIEMRKGRWCRVLESKREPAPADPYLRVVTWLDREYGEPLLAEAYDADNHLLKEFSLGSVKKVGGRYQIQDVKISNVQTHSRTWLEFDLDKRADAVLSPGSVQN